MRLINCWKQTESKASPNPTHYPKKQVRDRIFLSLTYCSSGHMVFAYGIIISQLTRCNAQVCNLKMPVRQTIYQTDFYSCYFIFNSNRMITLDCISSYFQTRFFSPEYFKEHMLPRKWNHFLNFLMQYTFSLTTQKDI